MRIYLIRHADPDYENHTITAAGHLEAQALAQRLSHEGIDRIYCSPLPRALHTMQYTADLLQLEPEIQPWMAELGWMAQGANGRNMAAWNVAGEQIREAKPYPHSENWHDWGPFREGEFRAKYELLAEHSDGFLAALGFVREGGKYRIVRGNKERIAVFCHLGFGMTWLAHLLELPLPLVWSGFWKAPSSVTTLLMDERSPQWAVPRSLGVGDVSHLYASDLPVSSQGIITNFD